MSRESHIDTRRLILDAGLIEEISKRTSTTADPNGCVFFAEGREEHYGTMVPTLTDEGDLVGVNILRLAYVLGGNGHLNADEEARHVCQHTGTSGKKMCIAPSHLTKANRREKTRVLRRSLHRARMKRTFGGFKVA